MEILVKRLYPEATLPRRATPVAAGLDLCACCGAGGLTLAPMERVLIPTGLAVELPENTVGLIYARSGLALREGLAMANGVGVVDQDYRGELAVPMVNLSAVPVRVANGQRVAQLVVQPVVMAEPAERNALSETPRGGGGFGSTGRL